MCVCVLVAFVYLSISSFFSSFFFYFSCPFPHVSLGMYSEFQADPLLAGCCGPLNKQLFSQAAHWTPFWGLEFI